MCKRIREDIAAVRQRDPAARSGFEILLMYAGVHALFWHRPAHWLYRHHCFFLARLVSQLTRFFTGIEIHPGAVIGHNVFIDHGSGIVIGETAEVGDGCTLYQGVTLGGTGKDTGKRHPTLGRNVMVGCGAKVLGPVRVGDNCKIAANAVLLHSIDADSTAVGVPARVVRVSNVKLENERLDQCAYSGSHSAGAEPGPPADRRAGKAADSAGGRAGKGKGRIADVLYHF